LTRILSTIVKFPETGNPVLDANIGKSCARAHAVAEEALDAAAHLVRELPCSQDRFGMGVCWHGPSPSVFATWFGGSMTKSNTALSLRADDDPVLAAIELTANAWQRFVDGRAREPKDADGKAAILTPAYARWQAAQDDTCQDWDSAYIRMLATPPTTAAGAAALIGAFLQYERAVGTELENVAPLLQTFLTYLEGCEAANPQRHRTLSSRKTEHSKPLAGANRHSGPGVK
jgi:hypothetical protein